MGNEGKDWGEIGRKWRIRREKAEKERKIREN